MHWKVRFVLFAKNLILTIYYSGLIFSKIYRLYPLNELFPIYISFMEWLDWLLNFLIDIDIFLQWPLEDEEFLLCNLIYMVHIFALRSLSWFYFCLIWTRKSKIYSWMDLTSWAYFFLDSAKALIRCSVASWRFSIMRVSSLSISMI